MLFFAFFFLTLKRYSGAYIGPCKTSTRSSIFRDGSRTAAISKMKRFVVIVNGWKPLTIIKKRSILDVAAVLDPSLKMELEDELDKGYTGLT